MLHWIIREEGLSSIILISVCEMRKRAPDRQTSAAAIVLNLMKMRIAAGAGEERERRFSSKGTILALSFSPFFFAHSEMRRGMRGGEGGGAREENLLVLLGWMRAGLAGRKQK